MQTAGTDLWNQFQQSMGQEFNPDQALNAFMGAAPGFLGMAQANFDPYYGELAAQRLSEQAGNEAAAKYAGMGAGAGRSGAAMGAIGEAMVTPLAAMNAQLASQIGGQAGQLQGMGMGNIYGAYNLGGQLQAGRQSLLGGLYGQNQAAQAQMSSPYFWEQSYSANPNYMGIKDILGMGSDLAGMYMMS
jgi:hypothetical protein